MLMVMEFAERGDLHAYLRENRSSLEAAAKASSHVPVTLVSMALDIAKGMKFVAEMGIIHRDLAARNCLVRADGSVAISDFGRAIHIKPSKLILR